MSFIRLYLRDSVSLIHARVQEPALEKRQLVKVIC